MKMEDCPYCSSFRVVLVSKLFLPLLCIGKPVYYVKCEICLMKGPISNINRDTAIEYWNEVGEYYRQKKNCFNCRHRTLVESGSEYYEMVCMNGITPGKVSDEFYCSLYETEKIRGQYG